MKTIRINFRHFWPGFTFASFKQRFPFLLRHWRFELSDRPDVLFYSCFPPNARQAVVPKVDDACTRVFITHENLRPDLATCDFAISFTRDIDSDRHLRLPNYVCRLFGLGIHPAALVKRNDRIDVIRAAKTHFCVFVQSHDVAFRNDFVRRLARYRLVLCAGPCLNNTGTPLPAGWRPKLDLLQRYKFVVAFENESSPGYTTEKITDAMLVRSVPLYWGDPSVHLDFNPRSFVNFHELENVEEIIDRVVTLDRDDALYEEMLTQPYYAGDRVPPHCDPATILPFFSKIFEAAGR
ncbi:MAG: glycosyltransferase family 10 [Planctomycetota bacterium]